jgi:hypothetical protein
MPYLIDGNNLIPALGEVGPEVGRVALCELLARAFPAGEDICVVFDGPRPDTGVPAELDVRLRIMFSPGRPADLTIIDRIESDTAPKRLIVVSSDREIRQHARRRRCQSVPSDEFAATLVRLLGRPRPSRSKEPSEKHEGLAETETDHWLDYFGMDGKADDRD